MTWTRIAAVAALAAFARPAVAVTPEAALAGARAGFEVSLISPLPAFKPTLRNMGWQATLTPAMLMDRFMRDHSAVLVQADLSATAAAPQAEVDLAGLLNKQLKTSLKYNLGGKDVWVGGAFDKAQNAFVSILVDGQAVQFFNVKSLLDKEQPITAGSAQYKLYLAPNVINQMKSEIILENAANEDDKIRITLKKMMDAVGAAGAAVTLGDQNYRVFYTDDIKNDKPDASAKVITFFLVDASGEIHIFLIPGELVPSDRLAVFKMYKDKRVGLVQAGGKLKVYENP